MYIPGYSLATNFCPADFGSISIIKKRKCPCQNKMRIKKKTDHFMFSVSVMLSLPGYFRPFPDYFRPFPGNFGPEKTCLCKVE